MINREIREGRQLQGAGEEIIYTLTVPDTWGVPTGTPIIKVFSFTARPNTYIDVTATVMPTGSATVLAQVITLPKLKALTEGTTYRIEIKFLTTGGDTKEAFAWLSATR